MTFSNSVRTTVITGASGGIGKAVTHFLRARGEQVIGVDLHDADVQADLSDTDGRACAIEHILGLGHGIDAVMTCAGISLPDDGARTVSVNFFGATEILSGLLPALRKGRHPRALAISSIATVYDFDVQTVEHCLAGREREAGQCATISAALAYASSKVALTRWVRRTAVSPEWGGKGVLLNAVAPGTIKTPMANPYLDDPEARAALVKMVPLAVNDYAEPEEIAPLLAFLVSPDNRFMVGQVPFVDGGSDILLRGDNVI